MNIAYVVRCNFNDPTKEGAWNDWYSGPKLKQMLEKPYFLTGQRFYRVAGNGRDYLAFWTLASNDAFTTPEYTNDWGFFEWRPYIIDWSRDLFSTEDNSSVKAPRLPEGGFIRLISFEGLSPDQAQVERAEVDKSHPGTIWHRSIGLDRHTELLGISIEANIKLGQTIKGVHEVFYKPISIMGITDNLNERSFVN